MKATEVLVSQHVFLNTMLEEMGRAARTLETLAEIASFARLAETLARDHGRAEESFLFAPLDNVLVEKGQLSQLCFDHRESVGFLRQAQEPRQVEEARGLLLAGMARLREHFRDEEGVVIPLAEESLPPQLLEKLGDAWMGR
ncbi:MAG: hemerythrin domain-containing protein [Verrucomicrobia bacterium]|nr:hemerythrin domain-containing protein [Verrucomicrobiota bacterium]